MSHLGQIFDFQGKNFGCFALSALVIICVPTWRAIDQILDMKQTYMSKKQIILLLSTEMVSLCYCNGADLALGGKN